MRFTARILGVAALVASSALTASAATMTYTSQTAFDAAATGLTTYTVPAPSGGASDQYLNSPVSFGPITLKAYGGFDLYNDGGYGSGQTYIGTYSAPGLEISFSSPVTEAGFNFGTYYGPETVHIDVNGDPAALISTPGAPQSSFFGVISSTPIDSISLYYYSDGGEVDILNGQVGSMAATPEPSSLVLLGTGILGGAAGLRRRFARS